MPRKHGDDDQQAGVAAGENAEGCDLATCLRVIADHVPEAPARVGIQRLQVNDAKQLEERLRRFVEPLEPTGRGGKQHDPRFQLQRLAKLPAEILAGFAAQGLQVLDHEDKLPAQPIRRLQNGSARTFFDVRVAPPGSQVGVRREEFPGQLRIASCARPGNVEQCFEPEVRQRGDLLALFHEPHGKQMLG